MPPRQKQKQRSVKGRLQLLPEMTLEIQVEIYRYLGSCDLLHMSQTCKRFRTFFLNRSVANERLWAQARANTGDLPERPPFMSEPAFIHLLYSPPYRRQRYYLLMDRQYAQRCETWHNAQVDRRIDEVIGHLRAKGWAKEVDALDPDEREELSQLPLVRQAVPKLTTAESNTICECKTVQRILEKKRHERIRREREPVLLARFDALEEAIRSHYVRLPRTASMEFRPRYIDFAFTDNSFRALLDAPTEQSVTATDFADLVPDATAAWEATQREELAAAIKAELPFAIPEDVDVLDLAVAFFPCPCGVEKYLLEHGAKDPLRFPAILGHSCPRKNRYTGQVSEDDLYSAAAMYGGIEHGFPVNTVGLRPFNVQNVPVSTGAIRQACNVVKAMGYDPARTTLSDLQGCNVLLTCVQCAETRSDVRVYTWDAAIRHLIAAMARRGPNHDKWQRVEDSRMERAHRLEESDHDRWMRRSTARYEQLIWSCSLCIQFDAKGKDMETHRITLLCTGIFLPTLTAASKMGPYTFTRT
ncbi:hypothetical protein GY45DRAFT_1432889 [Cubamyces sp. BRFM 1775]|nr:hypothetical protein GY45DRAFT_1432889 [Cubamyces sp. BRFM 1775]